MVSAFVIWVLVLLCAPVVALSVDDHQGALCLFLFTGERGGEIFIGGSLDKVIDVSAAFVQTGDELHYFSDSQQLQESGSLLAQTAFMKRFDF